MQSWSKNSLFASGKRYSNALVFWVKEIFLPIELAVKIFLFLLVEINCVENVVDQSGFVNGCMCWILWEVAAGCCFIYERLRVDFTIF